MARIPTSSIRLVARNGLDAAAAQARRGVDQQLRRGIITNVARQLTTSPQPRERKVPARHITSASGYQIGSLLSRSQLSVAAARRAYSTDSSSPTKTWSFGQVKALAENPKPNVVIVDVREQRELDETGRIPGAVLVPITSAPDLFHVPADEFSARAGYERPATDAELVIYCRAGVRARTAAELARQAGWSKVGVYPGSWLEWEKEGGPVEREGGRKK